MTGLGGSFANDELLKQLESDSAVNMGAASAARRAAAVQTMMILQWHYVKSKVRVAAESVQAAVKVTAPIEPPRPSLTASSLGTMGTICRLIID